MKRTYLTLGAVVLGAGLLAVAGLVSSGGCTQMLAWSVATFAPPERIKALYEVPKDKKVLVFVDDRPAPVSYEPVKYELAERVSKKLREEKLVKETIPYERLVDLSMLPDYSQMSISEIGKKLGADVVVYVQIESFTLKDSPENPLWQGRLATSVWVVDAVKPERLWPKDMPSRTGYRVPPLEFKHAENPSPTYGEEIAKALTEQMADRIAKLFYDHDAEFDIHHDDKANQSVE
jgi:hypothetical protein